MGLSQIGAPGQLGGDTRRQETPTSGIIETCINFVSQLFPIHGDNKSSPHPRVVVGSEQNFEWFPNIYLVRVMPQVHWQIHARFQWQAGFGFRHFDGNSSAEASTRLIAEF